MNQNSPKKMSCCSTTRKQLAAAQKECKFWRERYFIEKKCRNSISNWVLGVFGFVVKVECDRQTNQIRIEGRESRDSFTQAAISLPFSAEERVLLMEDRVNEYDFEPEPSELASLALASLEDDSLIEHQHQFNNHNQNHNGIGDGSLLEKSHDENIGTTQMQSSSIEISGSNNGSEILYIGNYDDGSGSTSASGSQPSYYILKNNDDTQTQQEYSFIQGDFEETVENAQQQQQVFFRLTAASESSDKPADDSTRTNTKQSNTSNTATNKKSDRIIGLQPSIKKKKPHLATERESRGRGSLVQLQRLHKSSSKPKRRNIVSDGLHTSPDKSKKPPSPSNDEYIKPMEFEITLREKAEIYVRAKAKDAIQKIGTGFVCSICPVHYSYSTIDNALAHTKTHFEKSPYLCEFCKETFAIQKELLRHRKLMHPRPKGFKFKARSACNNADNPKSLKTKDQDQRTAITNTANPNSVSPSPPVPFSTSVIKTYGHTAMSSSSHQFIIR